MKQWLIEVWDELLWVCRLVRKSEAVRAEQTKQLEVQIANRLRSINMDLQEELKRTGAHRDELQARYRDQEADREIKLANEALRLKQATERSERARRHHRHAGERRLRHEIIRQGSWQPIEMYERAVCTAVNGIRSTGVELAFISIGCQLSLSDDLHAATSFPSVPVMPCGPAQNAPWLVSGAAPHWLI